MRHTSTFAALILALGLVACPSPRPDPYIPPPRPTPVPPPIPIPPTPTPIPTPPPGPDDTKPLGEIVPFEKTAGIAADMPRATLLTLLGREPFGEKDMRDGTHMLRWPSLGSTGLTKWLDVQVNAPDPLDRSKDTVFGYSLVPRTRTK